MTQLVETDILQFNNIWSIQDSSPLLVHVHIYDAIMHHNFAKKRILNWDYAE